VFLEALPLIWAAFLIDPGRRSWEKKSAQAESPGAARLLCYFDNAENIGVSDHGHKHIKMSVCALVISQISIIIFCYIDNVARHTFGRIYKHFAGYAVKFPWDSIIHCLRLRGKFLYCRFRPI
jgi:hypothetical protein